MRYKITQKAVDVLRFEKVETVNILDAVDGCIERMVEQGYLMPIIEPHLNRFHTGKTKKTEERVEKMRSEYPLKIKRY